MTQNQKIQGKFFPFTHETYLKLKEARLTAAEWRLWAYLVTLVPFGDRYEDLPDTLTILNECEISKPTFYVALAKLQSFELFDFQDKGFQARNLTYPVAKIDQKMANSEKSEKSDNCLKNQTEVKFFRQLSEKSENQSPEPLQDKDSDLSQTIQKIQIYQTAEGEGEIFSEPKNGNKPIKPNKAVEICTKIIKKQIETTKEESKKEEKKISKDGSVKEEFSARPVFPKKMIEDSNEAEKHQEKLESLGIEWRRVKNAIARAHESQILGAIAHVEMNWEEIKDPSAVFLYQLPKQKIEQLSAGKVFRAAEAHYTLDQVKRLYPSNWREAAAHFGFDVSAQPNGLSLEEADG